MSVTRKNFLRLLQRTLIVLLVVAAGSVLLSTLFFSVLKVSGSSMEPTLEDQDIIVLARTKHPETGELVGFYYQNKILLKRVIAGPGDWVDIDADGNVSVNGTPLDEPYVTSLSYEETDRTYPLQVPEEKYFVMGDNRRTSLDSRSSLIGYIGTDQMIGKVILRIWPVTRVFLF